MQISRLCGLAIFLISLLFIHKSDAWTHGSATLTPPAASVVCTITTGNCTGTGGGSSLFTAATCNGVSDDAGAFISFNNWAVGTWQASHSGYIELHIPSGSTCEFISGNVTANKIGNGIKLFSLIGDGTAPTLADNGGTGGGFFLGCGVCGVKFNGTASTVLVATVSAGASSITILDTSKCSLWNAGDWALVSGIDPEGFGDPPSPFFFDWVQIASTASCAGSGVITLNSPLTYAYKSTWPSYNQGDVGHSNQGGPATLYQLDQTWNVTQGYYNLTIDQRGTQTSAPGRDITLSGISCPLGFCVIPSENQFWRVANYNAPNADIEFDKIVGTMTMQTVVARQIKIQQSSPKTWTCTDCTINHSMQGTPGNTTFVRGNIADLQIGAIAAGPSGSFTATNTVISSLEITGANQNAIDTRGTWASGNLTIPKNLTINSYADNGSGLIRLTVPSTAGWSNGIVGDGCGGTFAISNLTPTTVDLAGSTFSAGVCSGTTAFGSLPANWAVPGANVYFGPSAGSFGPMLQVNDLTVGVNGETVISFNKGGSPYAGGFPVSPTGGKVIADHPAPSWSCIGCTGAINVTDVASAAASGLPFGSYTSRVVTAANSGNATAMPTFGELTELDVTVNSACGAASNFGFAQAYFFQVLGSSTRGVWNPTINAAIASATPRIMTETTTSGAQSGDSLVAPGANTWLLTGQTIPQYSAVGNCGSASTTVTVKTNQSVVFP